MGTITSGKWIKVFVGVRGDEASHSLVSST